MIQSVLSFVLGFLSAALIALLVAPAVWRRAVRLTRKRVEAQVPMSLEAIQADKDRMRAEFAMSQRRLEMSFKAFREKAAQQIVDINRSREELKAASREKLTKSRAMNRLEAKVRDLTEQLKGRDDSLKRVSDRLLATEKTLGERTAQLDKLERLYDEASFSSSTRQIELVARESEVEKLSDDINSLRTRRQDAETKADELAGESRRLAFSLEAERGRGTTLDRRLASLTATLAERDAALREGKAEVERLRAQIASAEKREEEIGARLLEVQSEALRLEAGQAELEDENRMLKRAASSLVAAEDDTPSPQPATDTQLREEMSELAAEVVRLSARLDGPDSPIMRELNKAEPDGGKVRSLADRVRALQQAAEAAE